MASRPMRLALSPLLLVSAISDQHVVVEHAQFRSDWRASKAASPSTVLPFSLAVKPRNLDQLQQLVLEVSTPGNPLRGKYMSYEEVNNMTKNLEGTERLRFWLESAGILIDKVHPFGSYIHARANVSLLSSVLRTTFMALQSHVEGREIVRATTDISCPAFIAEHLSGIFSLTQLPSPPRRVYRKRRPIGGPRTSSSTRIRRHLSVTDDCCDDTLVLTGNWLLSNLGGVQACVGEFVKTQHTTPCGGLGLFSHCPVFRSRYGSKYIFYSQFTWSAWVCGDSYMDASEIYAKADAGCTGSWKGSDSTQAWIDDAGTAACGTALPPFPPSPPPLPPGSVVIPGQVTPSLLNAYYGVDESPLTQCIPTSQAVIETGSNYFSQTDLAAYQQWFVLPPQRVSTFVYNGQRIAPNQPLYPTYFNTSQGVCNQDPSPCSEPNLDVQVMMSLAKGASTQYRYDSDILTAIQHLSEDQDPPKVVSFSYEIPEDSLMPSTLNAFNVEAMKLSAQGVTLIAASGDQGAFDSQVASDSSVPCQYRPVFPASCPHVTAVGATQGPEQGAPEIVCSAGMTSIELGQQPSMITSGGGFSTHFARPSWQPDSVINGYLAMHNPVPGFDATNRAYPDVAMMGKDYAIMVGGEQMMESGTSASAPVFAALVTLANAHRQRQGDPPLGFLNPSLYHYQTDLTRDIVAGNNSCTEAMNGVPTDARCCPQGFAAATGWDPVSGWGSIRFDAFLTAFGVAPNASVPACSHFPPAPPPPPPPSPESILAELGIPISPAILGLASAGVLALGALTCAYNRIARHQEMARAALLTEAQAHAHGRITYAGAGGTGMEMASAAK